MLGHFALVVFLSFFNLKNIWEEIKKIDKKIWFLLLIVFLYGFFVRNAEYWLGTHTDAYVAQEAAHLWVLHGEFVKSCALGNHADCQLFEQVLAPPGSPFIIALANIIFGIHSLNASVISALLSSLTILLAFLLTYLIFKKEEASLYAALAFSLVPLNIINSQTGESRPTGLFFAGLAFLFFVLALKNNKVVSWLACVASLSYAIYVRQESYILAPFFALFFIVLKWPEIKNWWQGIKNKQIDFKTIFWGLFIVWLFVIMQLPVLQWLLFDNPYSSYQGGEIGFFALTYKTMLIAGQALLLQFLNISPAINNIWHYNLLTSAVFWLTGLAILFWKRKKEYWLPWGFFGAYFLVYSLMFDGNIYGNATLTTDYVRRTLMFHLPIAIIAGYGFYLLNPLKHRRFLALNLLVIFLLSIFLNVIFTFNFSNQKSIFADFPGRLVSWREISKIYFPGSLFKDARATKQSGDFSLIPPFQSYWKVIDNIPNGCLVIGGFYMTVINDYFKDNQRRTLAVDLINDETKGLFLEEFKNSSCIAYIADYRCRPEEAGNGQGCGFINDILAKKEVIYESPGGLKAYRMELKEGIAK